MNIAYDGETHRSAGGTVERVQSPVPRHKSLLARVVESQPPGEIGPRFVKGLVIGAVVVSAATKNTNAIKAVGLGIAGGTTGDTLNSLIGHRQGAHGSIKTKPGIVNESLRFATTALGCIRMRAVAMHRYHHKHADTPLDVHAPSVHGRGEVFTNITQISDTFAHEHADYTREVMSEGPYTSPRKYENTGVMVASVIGVHMAAGKKLGLPIPHRLASAGIHSSIVYIQNAMFTADVHSDNTSNPHEIKKFGYGRATNVIFGSEDGHAAHHEHAMNPRHSDFDAVYGTALAMRKVGLAEMPYLDHPRNHDDLTATTAPQT